MAIPDYPQARIVFCDLDNTLYGGTMGIDIARHLLSGLKALKIIPRLTATMAMYLAGRAQMDDFIQASSAAFRGEDKISGYARVREGTRRHCLHKIYVETEAALRLYSGRGVPVVVMGTAPQPAVEMIAEAVGATRAVGTEMEIDAQGRMTDRPIRPVPHGNGKLEIVKKVCGELGIPLSDAVYLGDSPADAAVLSEVGFPICINPRGELNDIARARSWPVHSTSRTRG
ncbi:MAG: HAD family phosphatase [Deltaproteobacteria bacterium]|nr:HAD family phosphatase [Deltaproteobacteria bacterium]